jgi:segregation and condensation protein B
MAFNLKLVLKALLFSSNQPLAIKDIQAVFTRYHEKAQALHAANTEAAANETAEVPADETAAVVPSGGESGGEAEAGAPDSADMDAELYADVPSLVTATQIREAMDELAAELRAQNDIYLLIDGASGFRIVTQPRFARWIRTLRDEPPPAKLSQSALETLAVVAYRQPVTRSELESIRGVSCETVMNRLLERELVYVVGRADLPGRPLQFGTTDKFLEFVGVKSLVELPASDVLSPRQIDEWLNHTANATPPADAEMGLPLEEGEGASPSLNPVNIEHVENTAATETPAAEPAHAPAPDAGADAAPAVVEPVSPPAEPAAAEAETKPQPSPENA